MFSSEMVGQVCDFHQNALTFRRNMSVKTFQFSVLWCLFKSWFTKSKLSKLRIACTLWIWHKEPGMGECVFLFYFSVIKLPLFSGLIRSMFPYSSGLLQCQWCNLDGYGYFTTIKYTTAQMDNAGRELDEIFSTKLYFETIKADYIT